MKDNINTVTLSASSKEKLQAAIDFEANQLNANLEIWWVTDWRQDIDKYYCLFHTRTTD